MKNYHLLTFGTAAIAIILTSTLMITLNDRHKQKAYEVTEQQSRILSESLESIIEQNKLRLAQIEKDSTLSDEVKHKVEGIHKNCSKVIDEIRNTCLKIEELSGGRNPDDYHLIARGDYEHLTQYLDTFKSKSIHQLIKNFETETRKNIGFKNRMKVQFGTKIDSDDFYRLTFKEIPTEKILKNMLLLELECYLFEADAIDLLITQTK